MYVCKIYRFASALESIGNQHILHKTKILENDQQITLLAYGRSIFFYIKKTPLFIVVLKPLH